MRVFGIADVVTVRVPGVESRPRRDESAVSGRVVSAHGGGSGGLARSGPVTERRGARGGR